MPLTREQQVEYAAIARAAKAKKRASRKRSGRILNPKSKAERPRRRKPIPVTDRRPIEPNVDYPLEVFMRYTGMTENGIFVMQREGLRVSFRGQSRMILGSDWIEFRERRSKVANGEGGAS